MTNRLVDIGFTGARLRNGALAGVAGGVVFRMMMQMTFAGGGGTRRRGP